MLEDDINKVNNLLERKKKLPKMHQVSSAFD